MFRRAKGRVRRGKSGGVESGGEGTSNVVLLIIRVVGDGVIGGQERLLHRVLMGAICLQVYVHILMYVYVCVWDERSQMLGILKGGSGAHG